MAKFRADECEGDENENEERDIFNNEALENPISSELIETCGMEPGVGEKNRPRGTITVTEERVKNSNTNSKIPENILQTSSGKFLKSSIIVECPKMNESNYRGTIYYTEAKEKIFCNGLGLSPDLLSAVRMTFKNHLVIQFKHKVIDIASMSESFSTERNITLEDFL